MPARRTSSAKLDLVRTHAKEYRPSRAPFLLDLPPARYLTITGSGRPGGRGFQEDLRALYGTAYTLKFLEKERGRDFRVPMLEGIYRPAEGANWPLRAHRPMKWRLLVRVPDDVAPAEVARARRKLRSRGNAGRTSVRLWTSREGRCVQALHVGPYSMESGTIDRMGEAARAAGLRLAGPHHEIYFSDPRRVAASRLRTVLRIPVRPAAMHR